MRNIPNWSTGISARVLPKVESVTFNLIVDYKIKIALQISREVKNTHLFLSNRKSMLSHFKRRGCNTREH